MIRAVGLVEYNSIARGIEAADAMLKAAEVEILVSKPICPGKYITLITGETSAVEDAVNRGVEVGTPLVIDQFVLPNLHPSVIPAIVGTGGGVEIKALGIIETFSVAALIVAADKAAKSGAVELIEIRMAMGIGGKSYVTLTGDVGSVKSAVAAGSEAAAERGLLVEKVVIPAPHRDLLSNI